jgi:GDP-4-dehydro-6-deoxy-D-mannose reductase
MIRVLISGAGGFVGSRVASLLRSEGARVATVGSQPGWRETHFEFGPAPWTSAQWSKALVANDPDVIFHLAGTARGSVADFEHVNVDLTRELLSALRTLRMRPVLVFAGSAAEYGDAIVDGVPVREDAECAPRGCYGRTKLAQTSLARVFAEETRGRILVARLFNAVGPGMPTHLALGDFARQIAAADIAGGPLLTGDIDVERDFIDISHVATALTFLARQPAANGIVNVCSGVPTKLRRLIVSMIVRSGKPLKIKVDPSRLRPGEPRVIVGSTERLAALGAMPPPTDIETSVASILSYAECRNSV